MSGSGTEASSGTGDAGGTESGEYSVGAYLSCYIGAMGGVEFGSGLFGGAVCTVSEDGSESLTLSLTKGEVTIYTVTCYTFVDASPAGTDNAYAVADGTIGYYLSDGTLVTGEENGVTYTLSGDTATNTYEEEVNYVDSVTFPLEDRLSEIRLTLYVNSTVMGRQFCEESEIGSASSAYSAVLTLDWDDTERLA